MKPEKHQDAPPPIVKLIALIMSIVLGLAALVVAGRTIYSFIIQVSTKLSLKFEYLDCEGKPYTARIAGDTFVLTARGNIADTRTVQALCYETWDGKTWEAKIDRKLFFHTPRQDGFSHPDCVLNYLDWDRRKQQINIACPSTRFTLLALLSTGFICLLVGVLIATPVRQGLSFLWQTSHDKA
jgi:ABC-type phosphate transport system permease subunit